MHITAVIVESAWDLQPRVLRLRGYDCALVLLPVFLPF